MTRRKQTLGERSAEIQNATGDLDLIDQEDQNSDSDASAPVRTPLDKADPPPGVPVQTRVTQAWTAQAPLPGNDRQPRFPQAGNNTSNRVAQADALTEFLETYDDGEYYAIQVTREPDPMLKRYPNPGYRRPCSVTEILGSIPFNRASFLDDIRQLNGESGGSFNVQIFDNENNYLETWRGNIADPIGSTSTALVPANQPEKPKTLIEALEEQVKLKELMDRLHPATPAPLSEQDQVMKSLLGHPDIIGTFMGTMTTAIRAAAEAASAPNVPKADNVREMALQAIFADKALQDKLVNTGMRALEVVSEIVLPGRLKRNPADDIDYSDQEPDEETTGPGEQVSDENQDEATLIMFLTNECAEGRSITFDHDIFNTYQQAQPSRYNMLKFGLKSMGAQQIVDLLCKKAENFNQGALARLVWNRPEAIAWLNALKETVN